MFGNGFFQRVDTVVKRCLHDGRIPKARRPKQFQHDQGKNLRAKKIIEEAFDSLDCWNARIAIPSAIRRRFKRDITKVNNILAKLELDDQLNWE